MADLNKFEKMLELLVNENKEAAQELFHEIVVEKSRDIYESLLEDEDDVEEATDEEVDESDEDLDEADDEAVDESDEDLDENFSLDSFEVEGEDDMGGDPTDDMMADLGMDDEGEEGEEEGEEGDMEDRVEDLEDALDDLKAEFEKMMAGDDEGEEGDMDMDMDMDAEEEPEEAFAFESADEEVDESDDTEIEEGGHSDQMIKDKENMSKAEFEKKYGDAAKDMDESAKSASETMREYVEKVSATMGDNGADTKSAVAAPNKMGDGTTANLVNGGESKGEGTQGGLAAPTPKDMNTKNVNVPGAKGATKMSGTKGHGAEKKASGENGVNTKSTIGK